MKKQIHKKLTLKRETLRELTKAELRLVAGAAWTATGTNDCS